MGVRPSGSSRVRAVFLSSLLLLHAATGASAATLPLGFSEQGLASGLDSPTAMTLAPDGRIFITLQGGQIRVWDPVAGLLATPFATIAVAPFSGTERGLLGIALDPNFAVNGYVYVYYTTTDGTLHNRLGRLTANGNVATGNTPTTLVDFETLGPTNHNGGALNFGPDGKLYVATGENAISANAQLFTNRLGKILRYDTTAFSQGGSIIPADNPTFGGQTSGDNRAIWALGLRNPYTFAFNPGGVGPAMFINDVGAATYEEINEGSAGRNYGWPYTLDGDFDQSAFPDYTRPTYTYEHANGACAITGGAFYAPSTLQFGGDYAGDYFFADFCAGWIRRLDPAKASTDPTRVVPFASGLALPVDLRVDAAGNLYYLQRGGDFQLYRVSGTSPGGATAPTGVTATALGQLLRLSWSPAPDAIGYIVEAGTAPGAADLFNGNVGLVTSVQATLGVGTYYLRVRTVTAAATSVPSREAQATLTPNQACGTPPPPPPAAFVTQVSGLRTRLSWNAAFGATSYVLEAGTAAGLADLLSADIGNVTSFTADAPAGTYFVRVRAANACGTSAPSSQVPITLGCASPPGGPTALIGSTANGFLTVVWTGALGHTSYVMEAGRASGASDVFVGDIGAQPGFQVPLAAVPPGAYYIRVRGVSACGLSVASAEIAVSVP